MIRCIPLLAAACLALAAEPAALAAIPDSAYVHATPEGHLAVAGQRIRFWGIIGGFPNYAGIAAGDDAATRGAKIAKSHADSDALVARFGVLGFNLTRLWRYAERDYQRGDGSNEDCLDYFISVLRQHGMRIWAPSIAWIDARPEDAGLVDEPASAAAWTAAVREIADRKIGLGWIARFWDARMEAAQIAGIRRRADHVNRYTGLRVGDDPVYAIWELTNEEWWIVKMMHGAWRQLPGFFQASLSARWHAWLRAKYHDQAALVRAWGFLLPGESLDQDTVGLLPCAGPLALGDAGMDATARKALEALGGAADRQVGRDDVTRHRGEDLIAFYVDLQDAHKHRVGTALKGMGRSMRLAPLVYDTGIGYQIQSQWLQQQADAVAHDAYIDGWARVRGNQRWPWQTGLEEHPRISMDIPWLEHNKVAGKPFLCYETQIQQPAKFRAEFPLRLVALAAIQDWDAVCWHYWGGVGDITTAERPFDRAMDISVGYHPQGYHFTYDEVQNAMMRAAGLSFRGEALAPAAHPTVFTYGRRSLLDPDSMDYGGSYGRTGQHMLYTTYAHGVRIRIDPTRADDQVEGPVVRLDGQGVPAVITPTPEITFDTLAANLRFDAPAIRAFTGFLAHVGGRWRFAQGTELSDVRIAVPPTMPYPEGIADEQYIGFALYSTDGKPLAQSHAAACSLVSTSFNTGFELVNTDGVIKGTKAGTAPVLVARVGGTVTDPALAGMRWRSLDWEGRAIAEGTVGQDGVLRIAVDQPVWYVELTR